MKSLLVDLRQDQPILRIFNNCCEYCRPSNIYTFRCWRLSVKYNGGFLLMIFVLHNTLHGNLLALFLMNRLKSRNPPQAAGGIY